MSKYYFYDILIKSSFVVFSDAFYAVFLYERIDIWFHPTYVSFVYFCYFLSFRLFFQFLSFFSIFVSFLQIVHVRFCKIFSVDTKLNKRTVFSEIV